MRAGDAYDSASVASARFVEQLSLRGCADRRSRGNGELRRVRDQVGEEFLDDGRLLDARDDAHRTIAGRTGLDVDAEYPLEPLCQVIAARRSAGVGSLGSATLASPPPLLRLTDVPRARYLLFGA